MTFSHLNRRVHLYLGLALLPWFFMPRYTVAAVRPQTQVLRTQRDASQGLARCGRCAPSTPVVHRSRRIPARTAHLGRDEGSPPARRRVGRPQRRSSVRHVPADDRPR